MADIDVTLFISPKTLTDLTVWYEVNGEFHQYALISFTFSGDYLMHDNIWVPDGTKFYIKSSGYIAQTVTVDDSDGDEVEDIYVTLDAESNPTSTLSDGNNNYSIKDTNSRYNIEYLKSFKQNKLESSSTHLTIYNYDDDDSIIGLSNVAFTNPSSQTISGTNTFSGTIKVPTVTSTDNSTNAASTAFVKAQGYITGISSSDVTTALGYTPLQSSDISNMVTTDTTQDITSPKYFSANDTLIVENSSVTKGTNPASTQYLNISLMENEGVNYKNRLGCFETTVNTDGSIETSVRAYKNTADSGTNEKISVTYPASGSAYTYAPTPTEDTTASTQIDTVGARNTKLQNYALNSDVVKLTGDQNVGGTKTFTNSMNIIGSNRTLTVKNTGVTRGTAPSSDVNQTYYRVVDSEGKRMCALYHTWDTSRKAWTRLICYKGTTTDDTWIGIGCGYDSSGNAFTSAPACTATDSIVTTKSRTVANKEVKFELGNGLKIATKEISPSAAGDTEWTYGVTFTNTPTIMITRRSGASTTSSSVYAWVRGDVGLSSCKIYASTSGTFMLLAIGN